MLHLLNPSHSGHSAASTVGGASSRFPAGMAASRGLIIPGGVVDPPADVTLLDIWERWVLPDLDLPAQERTAGLYRKAIDHWNTRMPDPGVSWLAEPNDADTAVRQWRRLMMESIPAAATVNKQWRYLGRLFRIAVRQRLISRVPAWRAVPDDEDRIIRFTSASEIDSILESSQSAQWPGPKLAPTGPGEWWRTLIVMLFHFGFRKSELFRLQWRHEAKAGRIGHGIYFGTTCPEPRLARLDLKCPHGWLVYLPTKQKRFKTTTLFLPMPRVVREQLERVKPLGLNFVVPSNLANKSFYRTWHSILDDAGIDSNFHFTPHDLRRTAETVYDEIDPGIGPWITGHASRTVSDRAYTSYQRRAVRLMVEDLESYEHYPRWGGRPATEGGDE